MTAIPAAVRRAVLIRADGMCERCGGWSRLELHHRLFRSRGGQHTVSNIVAICGFGNHPGKGMCHGWAHNHSEDAEAEGWTIESGGNPELIPIKVGDSWFFLPASGRRVRCTTGEAVVALGLAGMTITDLLWVFPDGCRSATGQYPNDGNLEHVCAKYDPQHLGYWALP